MVKRIFDIAFVLCTSVVTVPIVLLLSLVVMLDGGSPFYVQRRVGKNGKVFRMVKLRSMVSDADRRLSAYLKENQEARREWEETQKLKRDPRITRIGRIIRKTSMDELPQFWNVLTGDMSVVGPRPMMPSQRDLYPGQAYFQLRPGVTGFWQIGDRNNTSFAARARYDSEYFEKVSFFTDVKVILKTIQTVFRCTGI